MSPHPSELEAATVIIFAVRAPLNPTSLPVYAKMAVRVIGMFADLTLGANSLPLLRLGILDSWQILRHIADI